MDQDAALEKIRKLLAMAEADGLADEARESYTAKAAELIAQYGVDRAVAEAGQDHPATPGDVTIDVDPPYALDKIGLLAAVAVPLGCHLVQRTRRAAGGSRVRQGHLFGMAADLERAQLLYTSLSAAAASPAPAGAR